MRVSGWSARVSVKASVGNFGPMAPFMRATSSKIRQPVKVDLYMLMETSMKETGWRIVHTASAFILESAVLDTKASGATIDSMVRERNGGPTAPSSSVIILTARRMAKADKCGTTATGTKDSSKRM